MKLLIAVRTAAGGTQPTFPASGSNSFNYGSQMHQFADGSKLYVAIVEVEAAFEIAEGA